MIVDRFQLGKVLIGERKRPDVRATWKGKPIVFEIQLSNTFISEVVKRDYFYKSEQTFLIWVFPERKPDRAMVLDEEFRNRRNLFVLDAEAQNASRETGRMMLRCHFVRPGLDEARRAIVDVEVDQLVALDDLQYPIEGYRPYFVDGDVLRAPLEKRLAELREIDRQRAELARQQRAAAAARKATPQPPSSRPSPDVASGPASTRAPVGIWQVLYAELQRLGRQDPMAHQNTTRLEREIPSIPDASERNQAEILLESPFRNAVFKLLSVQTGIPHGTKYPSVFEILSNAMTEAPGEPTRYKPTMLLMIAAWRAYQPIAAGEHYRRVSERAAFHLREAEQHPEHYTENPDFVAVVKRLFPAMAAVRWSGVGCHAARQPRLGMARHHRSRQSGGRGRPLSRNASESGVAGRLPDGVVGATRTDSGSADDRVLRQSHRCAAWRYQQFLDLDDLGDQALSITLRGSALTDDASCEECTVE